MRNGRPFGRPHVLIPILLAAMPSPPVMVAPAAIEIGEAEGNEWNTEAITIARVAVVAVIVVVVAGTAMAVPSAAIGVFPPAMPAMNLLYQSFICHGDCVVADYRSAG